MIFVSIKTDRSNKKTLFRPLNEEDIRYIPRSCRAISSVLLAEKHIPLHVVRVTLYNVKLHNKKIP